MAFRTGPDYTNPTAQEVYAPNTPMILSRVYPSTRLRRRHYTRLRTFVRQRVAALVDRMAGLVPPRILHVGWPVRRQLRGGGQIGGDEWVGLAAKLNSHFNTNLTLDQGVDSVSPPLELAMWVLAGLKPRGRAPNPPGETRAQCKARIRAHRTAWINQWAALHKQAYWDGSSARDRGGEYHPTLRLALRDIRPPDAHAPDQQAFEARLPGLVETRLRAQSLAYLNRLVHRYVNWDVRRGLNNQWQMPKFVHLSQRPFWSAALIGRGEQSATAILAVVRAHIDALLRIILR